MRKTTVLGASLLAVWALLTTGRAEAQPTYEPSDGQLPLPLYHSHPESGGFYATGGVIFYRQTNPLDGQLVAVRGLVQFSSLPQTNVQSVNAIVNADGLGAFVAQFQATAALQNSATGIFFGPGTPALDVFQVGGPNSYQPGFKIGGGWRFSDASTLSLNYKRLTESKYTAAATLFPPGNDPGAGFSNTFLFSPVFNHPNDFTGPQSKVPGNVLPVPLNTQFIAGTPATTITDGNGNVIIVPGLPDRFLVTQPTVPITGAPVFSPNTPFTAQIPVNQIIVPSDGTVPGIWNGASVMTLSFVQRFQDIDLTYRVPIYDTETTRCSGLVGPRITWIWERFSWYTVSLDQDGQAGPQDAATYSNVVSNYMYGTFVGLQQECYLGHGFAAIADVRASLYMDVVKTRAKYERADRLVQNKRARRMFSIVPEVEASLGMMWYPFEGVEIQAGYDFMAFFNTVSSPQPIDFDYGRLDPGYPRDVIRLFDGFHASIGLIF